MRIWLDAEYDGFRGPLISLALVAEDGREWYGVRRDDANDPWAQQHVIPHLAKEVDGDDALIPSLDAFLRSYSSVHIIADWTGDIERLCMYLEWAGGERVGPAQMTFEVDSNLSSRASRVPHNALEDARALMASSKQMSSWDDHEALLDLIADLVSQLCHHRPDGALTSNSLSAAEDGMRTLARAGRMTIVDESGLELVARWGRH